MALPKPGIKNLSVKAVFTLLTLLLLTTPAQGFIRHLCYKPLGVARIDPIISPGEASAHVHHLHGSSNLGIHSVDAAQLLEGNCTSCSIKADKSGYWTPAMYFENANKTYELLTTSLGITVYYKFEKRVNFEKQNYTIFPNGFRMIAGTNNKRDWQGPWPVPEQSAWGPADIAQSSLAEKALGFNCMSLNPVKEGTLAFPYLRDKSYIDANCQTGIRAELMFPSCWDGVNLDSPDHKSHVAYPTLIQDGACPNTHPVYLPILLYETIWNTQEFVNLPGQFVFANGDPTGYGYHGDFIAAWQEGIQQKIMDDPKCTDHDLDHRVSDGIQEHCPVVADLIQSQDAAANCVLERPEILQHEQVQGLLDALPGGISVSGVAHTPSTQSGIVKPTSRTDLESTSATQASIALAVSSEAHPATATSSTTAFVSPTASPNMILSTSTYTSDGKYIELVIAEEVVTTTITANAMVSLVARHGHVRRHGH